jgi:hypothetical protein
VVEAGLGQAGEPVVQGVERGGGLAHREVHPVAVLLGEALELHEQEDDLVHPGQPLEDHVEQALEAFKLDARHDDADFDALAGQAVLAQVLEARHGLHE